MVAIAFVISRKIPAYMCESQQDTSIREGTGHPATMCDCYYPIKSNRILQVSLYLTQ